MYTFDTNVIIYYLQNDPTLSPVIEKFLEQSSPIYISSITELELLSFSSLTSENIEEINALLSTVSIIPVDSHIAQLAAVIRRNYQIKTPDSIIAATALFIGTPLVTRNVKDFKRIRNLKIIKI